MSTASDTGSVRAPSNVAAVESEAHDGGDNSESKQGKGADPSRTDGLALTAANLPIDEDPEPSASKWHRAASRRKSFGRPSPLLRAQRSIHDDDATTGSRSFYHAQHQLTRLVGQVQEWIDAEKSKRPHRGTHGTQFKLDADVALDKLQQILHRGTTPGDDFTKLTGQDVPDSYFSLRPRKRSSITLQKLGRPLSYASESEGEVEQHPPSAPVVLDNSKTLSYSSPSSTDLTRKVTNNSTEAWAVFKSEIVRLSHTLKLKGWRRVPQERSHEIEVQRLSGALTNAVYVVFPPKDPFKQPSDKDEPVIPRPPPPKLLLRIYGPNVEHLIDRESELAILRRLARKNIGPKMLGTFTNGRFEEYLNAQPLTPKDLRNPSISQQIAKRMRELHQGIKLLPEERNAGPFIWQNWDKWKDRCEEVIEWLDDQIKHPPSSSSSSRRSEKWRSRGFTCGVEWKVFRQAVRAYRNWLDNRYNGPNGVKESLVFAHNDAQYGNLLRLIPDDRASPLLQPANEHRRLVVIDFEYANANTPGLEFANHFTEWCYNYHSNTPWACLTEGYPTPEEQSRFFRAYLNHVPHFVPRHPGQTPVLSAISPGLYPQSPRLGPSRNSSVSTFMLDSRAPPSSAASTSSMGSNKAYEEEERAREEAVEKEIKKLLRETRLWRVANSAQWVAWGIVQAKVTGMEESLKVRREKKKKETAKSASGCNPSIALNAEGGKFEVREKATEADAVAEMANGEKRDGAETGSIMPKQLVHDTATEPRIAEPSGKAGEITSVTGGDDGDDDDEEEFDYLAYAQDRALFFWGDVLGLGLVKEEELPADLVARVKRVDY